MSSLIKLEKINKFYSVGNEQLHVLKDIDLLVERGEMVAIEGMSGSGKSTLMHIIGCLDYCSNGRYVFSGQDVSHLEEHSLCYIRNKKIGFIFQSFFLLPKANALQNVMLPLFYRGMSRNAAERRAKTMLDKVNVLPFALFKPHQLSGGQQQRIAIARALVGDPDIILADEPTGALDSKTGNEVMDLLIHLHQNDGRTIMIITHDAAISRRCKRVVMIKDGMILKTGEHHGN